MTELAKHEEAIGGIAAPFVVWRLATPVTGRRPREGYFVGVTWDSDSGSMIDSSSLGFVTKPAQSSL